MGRETSRGQKVVDFQQWRRETGRDLTPAPPATPAPHHLVAGPLRVQLSGYRPRFGANRDWRCMLGGQVLYTRIFPSKGRDLAVLAAGPMVNLVILIAALALLFWGAEGGFLQGLAWVNLWIALFVLLENLIPLPRTLQGVGTDGRQILDILRGRQPA